MMSTCISPENAMTVILDTSDIADQLIGLTERFEKKTFGKVLTQLTRSQATEIIHAIVDDVLNSRLKWAKLTTMHFDVINKYIPWTCNLEGGHVTAYDLKVRDAFEILINERLDHFMPLRTWNIWSTKVIGSDIALIKGKDYRVYDWERRMSSGEWSM